MNADNKLTILVIDDHQLILEGTVKVLKDKYQDAEITTVKNARDAIAILSEIKPNAVILDLSIPKQIGNTAEVETGIELLEQIMTHYPNLNIVIQSSNIRTLIRIKDKIDNHQGGFTIADKSISEREMLSRVAWSMEGITHTKDLKISITIKPEWQELIELANQGLQDKAIAKKLNSTERTIRHYWTKIQDVLGVYPDPNAQTNLRVCTLNAARQEGLID
jgi:DNA-binding NarL/FixJ family response regulator